MDTTHRAGLRLLPAGAGRGQHRTALLLHGLGATADVRQDAGELLASDGWRALAPDLPGRQQARTWRLAPGAWRLAVDPAAS